MKATVKKIAEAYALLDRAKYSKMESADRRLLIKAMRAMKKTALDYEDFKQDSMKRLTPENAEELVRIIEEFNAFKPEERANALSDPKFAEALEANAEYSREVSECLREEGSKEIDLDFTPFSEDAFGALMDSNPEWSMGQAMLAEEILCGTDSANGNGK